MKKYLFLVSMAALTFTSCSDQTAEFVGDEVAAKQAREITFAPLARPTTRGANAILDATFPIDNSMEIACYQSAPSASNYFTKKTFAQDGSVWTGGANPQFWPLSDATLNFYAVSGYGVSAADISIEDNLSKATVEYTSAKGYTNATQSDIMYAFNRGAVVQTDNNLTFNGGTTEDGSKVNMVFAHALSQIDFQLKANSDVEATGGSGAITINSITLTGAKYTGTLTLTPSASVSASTGAVTTTVAWTGDAAEDRTVPNVPSTLTTTYAPAAPSTACLMIIPNATSAFTSFTINYTVNSHTYNYTYAPASTVAAAGYKYTFQINFRLHEITVNPSVTPWTESASGDINVL